MSRSASRSVVVPAAPGQVFHLLRVPARNARGIGRTLALLRQAL